MPKIVKIIVLIFIALLLVPAYFVVARFALVSNTYTVNLCSGEVVLHYAMEDQVVALGPPFKRELQNLSSSSGIPCDTLIRRPLDSESREHVHVLSVMRKAAAWNQYDERIGSDLFNSLVMGLRTPKGHVEIPNKLLPLLIAPVSTDASGNLSVKLDTTIEAYMRSVGYK